MRFCDLAQGFWLTLECMPVVRCTESSCPIEEARLRSLAGLEWVCKCGIELTGFSCLIEAVKWSWFSWIDIVLRSWNVVILSWLLKGSIVSFGRL